MSDFEYISSNLSREDILCQLAEEASELAQAALKLRRAITGTNPTPMSADDAWNDLMEEIADVSVAEKAYILSITNEEDKVNAFIRHLSMDKVKRWHQRVMERKMQMLDGVRVLNTIPAQPADEANIWLCMVVSGIVAVVFMFFILVLSYSDGSIAEYVFYSVVCGMIGGALIGIAIWRNTRTPEQPAQYEVIVSDGVDFKEFYERYEIIEQKGKIYVITERKTDG